MTPAHNGVASSSSVTPGSNSSYGRSYSEITEVRPSEEQGIFFNLVKDVTIREHTDALLEHIDLTKVKITHMSRIRDSRFSVYFSDASVVKELVNKVKVLSVKDNIVKISPVATEATKVIISNACPVLSNSAIKRFLTTELNIRTTSSVSELKANTGGDKRLAGVLSFRRQVYINPDDVSKLVPSQLFIHNGKKYNVFFSTDNPGCFNCHALDHYAKDCPEKEEEKENIPSEDSSSKVDNTSEEENLSRQIPDAPRDSFTTSADMSDASLTQAERAALPTTPLLSATSQGSALVSSPSCSTAVPADADADANAQHLERDLLPPFAAGAPNKDARNEKEKTKRTHSVISDSSGYSEIFEGKGTAAVNEGPNKIATTLKKPKIVSKNGTSTNNGDKRKKTSTATLLAELQEHLTPAEKYIQDNLSMSLLDYQSVVQLLKKTSGKTADVKRSMASSFNNDLPAVINLLEGIHRIITHAGTKNKITRLKNALKSSGNFESDSEYSSSSVK